MREKPTLEKILADFRTKDAKETDTRSRQAVTIWITPEDKARYDRLQKESGRRFSKKAREALLALLAMAEAQAS